MFFGLAFCLPDPGSKSSSLSSEAEEWGHGYVSFSLRQGAKHPLKANPERRPDKAGVEVLGRIIHERLVAS